MAVACGTRIALAIENSSNLAQLNKFHASDALDAKLAKYVVLLEATPQSLAKFAQQGKAQAELVEKMLSDGELWMQMLEAGGVNSKREGCGDSPAQYGQANKIHSDIRSSSCRSTGRPPRTSRSRQ